MSMDNYHKTCEDAKILYRVVEKEWKNEIKLSLRVSYFEQPVDYLQNECELWVIMELFLNMPNLE